MNFLFSVAVGFAAVFIRPRLVLDYWTPEGLNSFYSSDLTQRGVMKIHAASGHIWFNPVCILTAGLSVQALKVLVLHNTVPKSLDETDLEHTCECNKVMPYCSELYLWLVALIQIYHLFMSVFSGRQDESCGEKVLNHKSLSMITSLSGRIWLERPLHWPLAWKSAKD